MRFRVFFFLTGFLVWTTFFVRSALGHMDWSQLNLWFFIGLSLLSGLPDFFLMQRLVRIPQQAQSAISGINNPYLLFGITLMFFLMMVFVNVGNYHLAPWLLGTLSVVVLLGIWLRMAAIAHMGSAFIWLPKGEQQRVLPTGPYRWIRHPGYAAAFLIYTPLPLIAQDPLWVWVLTLLFLLIGYLKCIPTEEGLMRTHFGQEYEVYIIKVRGRIIPRVL